METRSIYELLVILYKSIIDRYKDCKDENYIYSGLCHEIHTLNRTNIIDDEEQSRLINFVHDNRPKHWYNRYYCNPKKAGYFGYFWKRSEKKIRLKFLKYHIKKQKKLYESK